MIKLRLIAVAAISTALLACAKDSPASPATHVAFGEWGGDKIQILASDTVTDVTDGCTGGTFAGNVRLDATGGFVVDGRWMPYFVPSSGSEIMPAQMSGHVSGNTITFAVAVYDTARKVVISIPPATATFGRHANLVVCP